MGDALLRSAGVQSAIQEDMKPQAKKLKDARTNLQAVIAAAKVWTVVSFRQFNNINIHPGRQPPFLKRRLCLDDDNPY